MILIFVSFESKKDAEKVANSLIDKKIAACVSLIPVKNFYSWKGKKIAPDEIEAIIKTKDNMFDLVKSEIKTLLAYEIPQIISVKAEKANDLYLKWLERQVK